MSFQDIKRRLQNVNKLPRLCYTVSNVIIYVDEANFARRRCCGQLDLLGPKRKLIHSRLFILSPFKHMLEFAQQSTTGVASSFPPSLLIVCNKCTINEMEMTVEVSFLTITSCLSDL